VLTGSLWPKASAWTAGRNVAISFTLFIDRSGHAMSA
jgi:hypothetical protein